MTNLKERLSRHETMKIAGLAIGGLSITLIALLAQAAQSTATLFKVVPCIYILGQPEMPKSMIQQIKEQEAE